MQLGSSAKQVLFILEMHISSLAGNYEGGWRKVSVVFLNYIVTRCPAALGVVAASVGS